MTRDGKNRGESLRIILLPGLDGSGKLFDGLIRVLPEGLTPQVISYPLDVALGYNELEQYILERIKTSEPFLILAESFSGPLAVRIAAKNWENLVALILCASFIRNPFPTVGWLFRPGFLEWLFGLPIPRQLIRMLLVGKSAANNLVDQFVRTLKSVSPKALSVRVQSVFGVDVRQELLACTKPILYLQATKDRVVLQRNIELIKKLKPKVKTVAIAAPHLLLQCTPQKAVEAIAVFLREMQVLNKTNPETQESPH